MAADIVVLPLTPPPPPSAPPPPPPPKPPLPSTLKGLRITPLRIQATQFKTYHGDISNFVAPGASKTQDFHAIINWGDGSKTSTGHIDLKKTGAFRIISMHRYVKRGAFPITITLRDPIGRKVRTVSLVRVIN